MNEKKKRRKKKKKAHLIPLQRLLKDFHFFFFPPGLLFTWVQEKTPLKLSMARKGDDLATRAYVSVPPPTVVAETVPMSRWKPVMALITTGFPSRMTGAASKAEKKGSKKKSCFSIIHNPYMNKRPAFES